MFWRRVFFACVLSRTSPILPSLFFNASFLSYSSLIRVTNIMALSRVRVALKNLQQRDFTLSRNSLLYPPPNYFNHINSAGVGLGAAQEHSILRRFSSESGSSDSKEVTVQTDQGRKGGGRWRSLLPRRFRKPALWRRRETHDPFEMFQTAGLGNALLEAAENMNRIFETIVVPTQTQLMGRFKENKDNYKLKLEVPGLSKEEVKVTVNDGVLRIRGERKVEDGDDEDEYHMMSYGYYDTSLVLPDDAKYDDIKAELKDGVLLLTIPKTENHGKDVKEVKIL